MIESSRKIQKNETYDSEDPDADVNIMVKQKSGFVKLMKRIQEPIKEQVERQINLISGRRMNKYEDENSEDSQDQDENAQVITKQERKTSEYKPLPSFKNHSQIFENLIQTTNVETAYPIMSMLISYDSSRVIMVSKKNNRESWIHMYNLETYEKTFEEKIGGEFDSYIKIKEVEQSSSGNKFAVVYNNDGIFYLRMFGKAQRNEADIMINELNINKLIGDDKTVDENKDGNGLNNHTMCISSFPDPFANCCFINEDFIYVCIYHNASSSHYHFIWNISQNYRRGRIVKIKFENGSRSNFPYKSFYNELKNEIYTFYRQGQALIINASNTDEYQLQQMTNFDLGMMYLIYNDALVARSSSDVLFFKIQTDPDTQERSWQQYHEIQARGLIYFIKGNKRIQITTDDMIYFYIIDKTTLMPSLDNVMRNFMQCNQVMFGPKVKYCVTYKTNQKCFEIYKRKYEHQFEIPIYQEVMENCFGLEIASHDRFLVSQVDKIWIHDSQTLLRVGEISINLLQTKTREPNQVISMNICQDDVYLAILTGKITMMQEHKVNQLYIYKKNQKGNNFGFDTNIKLVDYPFFNEGCMDFYFKITKQERKDTLIICKHDEIFEMNFRAPAYDEMFKTLYKFQSPFENQPRFFNPNSDQTIFMIASNSELKYVNRITKQEINIHEEFGVDQHKKLTYDAEDKCYYLVSNRYDNQLGFYVLKLNEHYNTMARDENFLIKWQSKLLVGDVDLQISKDSYFDENQQRNVIIKELIISFKMIYINTKNVVVMDITNDKREPSLVFRHESFQIWESECSGLFLQKKKEFLSINIKGIQVMSLDSGNMRPLQDANGYNWMMHSLESYNFLKADPKNYLLFKCSDDEEFEIAVEQEFEKNEKDQTSGGVGMKFSSYFWNLYNVKIQRSTLRELLFFNSLYISKKISDVTDIVRAQPNPTIFYKSLLEFHGSNLVSILSFDSQSMKHLLQDSFEEYFSKQYPLFFRNKYQKGEKFFYRNVIDLAIKSNQNAAIDQILDYIVKYQNTFLSSYLFTKSLPTLIESSINLRNLMDSRVFLFDINFEEWPQSHENSTECSRPFNENIFQLRQHYRTVYFEDEFEAQDEDEDIHKNNNTVYKIKYTLNLLPLTGSHIGEDFELKNEYINLLELFAAQECIEVYQSQAIKSLLTFKWDTFAFGFHLFGFCYHIFYIVILIGYTIVVYIDPNWDIKNDADHLKRFNEAKASGEWFEPVIHKSYIITLLIGIVYPFVYEINQLMKQGLVEYFGDLGNWLDCCYLLGSFTMAFLHMSLERGPFAFLSKFLMILVVTLSIRRTFDYMRIFKQFATIVTMIKQALSDIVVFMVFYLIVVVLFSLMIGVLGISNPHIVQGEFRKEYYQAEHRTEKNFVEAGRNITDWDLWQVKEIDHYPVLKNGLNEADAPGREYKFLNLMVANIIATIRASVGDYDLSGAAFVSFEENLLFWMVWAIQVIITFIVILNTIVAEISNSYVIISESLEQVKAHQKAQMTAEAEDVLPNRYKSTKNFPKYVITRTAEV